MFTPQVTPLMQKPDSRRVAVHVDRLRTFGEIYAHVKSDFANLGLVSCWETSRYRHSLFQATLDLRQALHMAPRQQRHSASWFGMPGRTQQRYCLVAPVSSRGPSQSQAESVGLSYGNETILGHREGNYLGPIYTLTLGLCIVSSG